MKKNKSKTLQRQGPQALAGVVAEADQLLAQRRFEDTVAFCQNTLSAHADQAALRHRLGIALVSLGRHTEAVTAMEHACRLAPNDGRIRNDLGIAQEKAKDFDAAETSYRKALYLAPGLAEAHSNLADLLVKLERPAEAVAHAKEAVRLTPSNPRAWVALGDAFRMQGKHEEAIAALENAIRLPPPQLKAFAELGRLYAQRNRNEEAMAVLNQGRSLLGDDPKILNDLGLAFGAAKKYAEAQPLFEAAYRQLQEPTTLFNIVSNLGNMERMAELFSLADEVLKHPQPNVALSKMFFHTTTTCHWRLQERLLPHFMEWWSMDQRKLDSATGALLPILAMPAVKPLAVRDILEKLAALWRQRIVHHEVDIEHKKALRHRRKLRIGYVSGDFRWHVVNYAISGLLSNYDKQYFEVYCYSNLEAVNEDGITEQYRQAVDKFVRVFEMTDQELARQIADDGIQVLIDLAGYTANSRINALFYRPAPVQITYIGYPFTTGMREIDYAASDPWLNGPQNARYYVEKVLEIPESCASMGELPVKAVSSEPPLRRNGFITFGSLSNTYKLNRPTVAAWSRILAQVPDAKLVLNHPRYHLPLTQENVVEEFGRNGIGPERISFIFCQHPQESHLYWYNDIDVSLDSFPQTGGSTTFESLWMGVPVVTLVGEVQPQRLSYSILKNCGVPVDDLIAFSVDEYVDRAVALARDHERIAALHRSLPESVHQSLLCDPARHVRLLEDTLIEAWNRKFPAESRLSAETFLYTRLNTPAAPLVATVSDDPENLFTYVVREQGRWFAPEYAALQALVAPLDGRAIELGSEPGFFGLEVAQAGMAVLNLATSAVAGRLIRAAAEKNGVAKHVEVRLESARTSVLDRARILDAALLRIGVEANDGLAGPVARNLAFWKANSPVVLASVHCGDKQDLSTAVALAEMGYRLYRFLPGLGFFVPYANGDALDPYTLYLLACPPHHEAPLVAGGMLVPEPIPVAAEAIPDVRAAQSETERIDEWIVQCALSARDSRRTSAERLGYHQAALRTQLRVAEASPSSTRLITLSRLLADAGRRSEAATLLHQVLTDFEKGSASLTQPFLAPSADWDDIPPGDRMAEWLLAALLETRCRLAAHSTFFLSERDLDTVETIASLGFYTPFLASMRAARQGRTNSPTQA